MTDIQKVKFLYLLENAYKKYTSLMGNLGCENHSVKMYKALLEVLGKGKAVDDQLSAINKEKNKDSRLVDEVMAVADEASALVETGRLLKCGKAERIIYKEDRRINDIILDKIRSAKDDVIARPIRLEFTSPKCLRAIENIEIISDITAEVLIWAGICKS